MPRIRKFEDDLIIESNPEGRIIFEGQGVRMLSSNQEIIDNLVQSAIEGKDFVGYVEDTCKVIFSFDILSFEEISSDEHTSTIVPFPFELDNFERYLYKDVILPLDQKHLFFAITDIDNDHMDGQSTQCYIFNIMTEKYRCLGEYGHFQAFSNYIMLTVPDEQFTLYQYNFSVNDMNEAYRPDIALLSNHGMNHFTFLKCLNADCVCFDSSATGIDHIFMFDRQRKRIDLVEKFPQIKEISLSYLYSFTLLTLTKDVLSIIFSDGSVYVAVHIEKGEIFKSSGSMECNRISCSHYRHIDFSQDFHDEECVFYGVCKQTKRYGPVKFRTNDLEVMRVHDLFPRKVFYNGIANYLDDHQSRRYFFNLKGKKIISIHNLRENFDYPVYYRERSVYITKEDNFYVIAEENIRGEGKQLVKIHWEGPDLTPIITRFPHGSYFYQNFILGLPYCVDYSNHERYFAFLGDTMILESPPNLYFNSSFCSMIDNYVCILCTQSIHFFQFMINEHNVKIEKHYIFNIENVSDVFFNPRPLVEIDHHLFVVRTCNEELEAENLYCLDWSTGRFSEPVLLYKRTRCDDMIEGNCFKHFLGDTHFRVNEGVYRVTVLDGIIKTRFFTNTILPPIYDENNNLNLPNNVVQSVVYEKETKTMVLSTYNVDEDPESMNPEIETFHVPSFLAEASITEYHMPHDHIE
ncbi:hypothetical protein PCE1_004666 [Barthelona sp. PCE]